MTVGVCIKCTDGVVLACDSLTTFGRGVPVLKYSNKVHILEHEALAHPVAIEAAGAMTFFDKFRDRALRASIADAMSRNGGTEKIDIIDFEPVAEALVCALLKEYTFDRIQFFGSPSYADFSLSLIVAGATRDNVLRAFFVHQDGVAEQIDTYGTIGSGAAYAELFLRFLLPEQPLVAKQAQQLAIYAVKGVELMDPNVGGNVNLMTLSAKDGVLECTSGVNEGDSSKNEIGKVLRDITNKLEGLVEQEVATITPAPSNGSSGSKTPEKAGDR